MSDYLVMIGSTKLKYILRSGYDIQEDQEIVLSEITTADGTKRRNIAEKRQTTIKIRFSQIDGQTLSEYCNLWLDDFSMTYWSKNYKTYLTGTFRVSTKPTNSMLYSKGQIYDEFEVVMESV